MPGFINYAGMLCACGACQARVADNQADWVILWANQHGAGIRIFCKVCGAWTDRNSTSVGIQMNIRKQPTHPTVEES